jgi:hypothetical protein
MLNDSAHLNKFLVQRKIRNLIAICLAIRVTTELMENRKVIRLVISAVAVLSLMIWLELGASRDFVPTTATITSVKTSCYVVDRKYGNKSDVPKGPYSCDEWKSRRHVHRKYDRRFDLDYSFDYVSPVDGSRQTGSWSRTHLLEEQNQQDAKVLSIGSPLNIRAHKTNPERYTISFMD